MRIRSLPAVLSIGLLAAACLPAAAQKPAATMDAAVAVGPGVAMAGEVIKTSATIVGIDVLSRIITFKRQDGKIVSTTVGAEVRNFEQLRIGDKVTAEYSQAIAIELKTKASGGPGMAGGEILKRADPGQKPGGQATRAVVVLADVTNVDAKNKTVTLKGPAGNLVEVAVSPEQLKNVKKGDQVEALYTESLAIKVETQK
jgi:hypothetical protein